MSSYELKWATEQRFRYVEHQAFWLGGLNRGDLTSHFGISVPQASKDLSQYQSLFPENIRYDHSEKRYFATAAFKPNFIDSDPIRFLEQLLKPFGDGSDQFGAQAERVAVPKRLVSPKLLQAIIQTISRSQSIEVLYQSMNPNKPDPLWRRITPHSFATDGMRWHVRAFCHIDNKFKDFLLSRCRDTRLQDNPGLKIGKDRFWNEYFQVDLAPNPALSESQQQIIANEYDMRDGNQVIQIRKAMLYYFEKRLRLDIADNIDRAGETPVIIENREEFDQTVREATG